MGYAAVAQSQHTGVDHEWLSFGRLDLASMEADETAPATLIKPKTNNVAKKKNVALCVPKVGAAAAMAGGLWRRCTADAKRRTYRGGGGRSSLR